MTEIPNLYSNNTSQPEIPHADISSPAVVGFNDKISEKDESILEMHKSELEQSTHRHVAMFGQDNKNMGAVFN